MSAAERISGVTPGTFLALLDQGELDKLTGMGVTGASPRGSVLMFEHEAGERVMIVLAGRVRISRVDQEGRELILSIRDPGDLLGELAFIDNHPRLATVTALEAVKALVIPSQTMRSHLEREPRVAVALLEVVTRRFRETTVKREQFTALDTMGRLAARLVELVDRYGEPDGASVSITLPLTREEIASWTGASRAGVAHAFQAMRDLGWIETKRRRVLVRDLQSLRSRAA